MRADYLDMPSEPSCSARRALMRAKKLTIHVASCHFNALLMFVRLCRVSSCNAAFRCIGVPKLKLNP